MKARDLRPGMVIRLGTTLVLIAEPDTVLAEGGDGKVRVMVPLLELEPDREVDVYETREPLPEVVLAAFMKVQVRVK